MTRSRRAGKETTMQELKDDEGRAAMQRRAEEEELVTVPISDLDRLFGGNRAQRRKFLSVLRKKVKASKKPNG